MSLSSVQRIVWNMLKPRQNMNTSIFLLARIAREILCEKFLNANMGISGGNFLIAETGTLVLVANEGNGRNCPP